MHKDLIPLAGNSILVAELDQLLKDIDLLDQKIDEYWLRPDKDLFERACLRKGELMAYRDNLVAELKVRFPT